MITQNAQRVPKEREQIIDELEKAAKETTSPHIRRELLKSATTLLECEIFTADFANLAKSSP